MLTPLIVAALQAQPPKPPVEPRRSVPDSGIIATGQQVTPAGVQSVSKGRVTGFHFGPTPGEVWAAAPAGIYRLSWKDNRAVATSRFDGAPGVHGIGYDATAGRMLVTTVGRRPE